MDWDEESDDEVAGKESLVPPLPHSDRAATGEVPAILSRDIDPEADPFASLGGPTWREEGSDWAAQDEEYEPSMLSGGSNGTLDTTSSDRQPWVFDLPGSSDKSVLDEDGSWDEESDDGWEDLELASAPSWSAEQDDPITAVLPAVARDEPEPPETSAPEQPGPELPPLANGPVVEERTSMAVIMSRRSRARGSGRSVRRSGDRRRPGGGPARTDAEEGVACGPAAAADGATAR